MKSGNDSTQATLDIFTNNKSNKHTQNSISFTELFKELYYYLYTNSNIPRAERLGPETIRILFCKVYDELYNSDNPQFVAKPNEHPKVVAQRIRKLFEKVKQRYRDVFNENEQLHLDDKSIKYIVEKIQNINLLSAERDAISEAFQAFLGPGLRGEKGQFFTPKNVVKMCIQILDPSPKDKIIDPACGSGGFLVESILHIAHKNEHLDIKDISKNIFGIDKEIDLVKIARAYMAIIGDGHSNIFHGDSLAPQTWPEDMRGTIKDNSFDIVLTNPPFGSRIAIDDKDILKSYELGHRWIKSGERWVKTNKILKKQAPQILFIERVIQLLRPGGRAAIVLPDGIFGNPRDGYIVEYLKKHTKILAIISLAPETFLPSTHTKTSVLIIEKKDPNEPDEGDYEIFMAIANKVGHDKNGKPLYKRDKSGKIIHDSSGHPLIDDDLPIIAERYKQFKKRELPKEKQDHLGFIIKFSGIKDNILIPSYYDPEIEEEILKLEKSGKFELVTIGDLVKKKIISIKRGHEVGSQYYGLGSIPFVRTSDISNWEIKIDPIKGIPREIYLKYKDKQDIKPYDILIVTDGTFLIGRTAIVSPFDTEIVIQSHIKRIRCLRPEILHPYLLLYLLNLSVVQKQIKAKTFVQSTISTIGKRLNEVVIPIPKDPNVKKLIINKVGEIIQKRIEAKKEMIELLEKEKELLGLNQV